MRTHDADDCIPPCPIHAPSDHHMREWPKVFRASGLTERVCEHGVGHPDPDSLQHFERLGVESMGIHGCCGCCHKEDAHG